MTAHGVGLVGRHPDIKDMAKGGALRVRLDASGTIAAVEIVVEAGRGALWTLRDGQQNGFPGLKTASGLLSLDADARSAHEKIWETDKTPTSRRAELLRLLRACAPDDAQALSWPKAGHKKRIAERLLQLAALRDDPLTAAAPAVFERFLLALDASPSFLHRLAAAIGGHVETDGDEWLDPARMAFFGPVALTIDVAADANFGRDAGDARQIGPISAALNGASTGANPQAGGNGRCALTGKPARLHVGNFPQPNLPGLGQTYIFARNSDIPSLTRYRRTSDASFAVGADLVGRLSGAITALTRDDAKGCTWRLIPAETGDKPDLLIASLASEPETHLADAIADDEEVGGESAFMELSSRVIAQSRGKHRHQYAQDEVLLLVLRAVDPANRKAIYHRRAKATDFFEATKRWQEAKSNTPDWLGFRMPVKGKPEIVFRRPPHVAPLSITALSRVQFANGGRRRVDVIGLTAATAFGLFLGEGDAGQSARRLLRLLLQRHGALLGGLAQAHSKGIERLKDFDPKTDLRRDALRSATWLGALLHHLGRSKEVYMSDVAFRLGQLLAAADVVHVGYCADLRGGDVPPTLLGNSVLAIAGAHPVRALSILQSRWKPYGAWARQVDRVSEKINKLKGGKDDRLAWSMRLGLSNARRIGPIAAELADHFRTNDAASNKPDDQFKAELLLGYMAGLPPLPKKEGSDASNDHGDDLNDLNEEEQQ
ncbi:MAG: hypothetical protein HYS06_02910 [Methylocystis sp.]|nr:hypothetical protein [Methylocystis sp.]